MSIKTDSSYSYRFVKYRNICIDIKTFSVFTIVQYRQQFSFPVRTCYMITTMFYYVTISSMLGINKHLDELAIMF